MRFSLRVLAEAQSNSANSAEQVHRVLVVGAGDAGALVVREMQKNPQLRLLPVCFLDDDPDKQNQQIHGVPVVGKLADLARVVTVKDIDEVIIAIPSAPGRVIRQVAEICRAQAYSFPHHARHLRIDGRQGQRQPPARSGDHRPAAPRTGPHRRRLIGASLGGKRVLVTGAGGSIGRELCRQIARWGPAQLILLGHGENSIFETLLELEENFPTPADPPGDRRCPRPRPPERRF